MMYWGNVMSAGRPRKYSTPEEAKAAQLQKLRERYARKKSGEVRSYDKTTPTEAFRGTKAYRMYYGCKSRSKKNGIPFDLDVQYVQELLNESDTCPLLGVKYDEGRYMPSLDKIIPELGYVKGNVWVVSYRANAIKNDATFEELRMIADGVERKLSK
jgi:hypothetical protein